MKQVSDILSKLRNYRYTLLLQSTGMYLMVAASNYFSKTNVSADAPSL